MIKQIMENINPDSLAIVSICVLSDSAVMVKDIHLYEMNWENIYNKYNEVGQMFDVSSMPELIVITKQGIIEYIHFSSTGDIKKKILSLVNGKRQESKWLNIFLRIGVLVCLFSTWLTF